MKPLEVRVPVDHPAFAGHFPGQPLLPGVSLLALVLEAALADPVLRAEVCSAPRLGAAKFLAPVGPGATLTVHLDPAPTALRFEVRDGARVAASGHYERAAT